MKKLICSAWYGSATRAAVIVALGLTLGLLPKANPAQACAGDCNANNKGTGDELLSGMKIALGDDLLTTCMAADGDSNGKVTVDDLLKGVNFAVTGTCGGAVCGNMMMEGDEGCDDGGTCIGGSNAGTHCTAETDCHGDGVCIGGPNAERPCSNDGECNTGTVTGIKCVHCVPQGGDGCAANCTTETMVPFTLKPGEVTDDQSDIKPGTSGAVVHGNLQIPLPLTGNQTFIVGKDRGGKLPLVVIASSVHFPQIDVGGLACACVRGVASKTCGGTAFKKDGGAATDCTPGYSNMGDTAHDGPCPAELPCTFVHGPGNSATGLIGCTGTQPGVDLSVTQDDANQAGNGGSCTADAQCASLPGNSKCIDDPDNMGAKFCSAAPPVPTLGGSGPAGSGLFLNSTAIGTQIGACTANFCTDSDPFGPSRGTIATIPLTTGMASGVFTTAGGVPDNTVCQCMVDPTTGAPPLTCCPATGSTTPGCQTADAIHCVGPLKVHGEPLDCAVLATGSTAGASLAGAFTSPHVPVAGDSVITTVFFGGPSTP